MRNLKKAISAQRAEMGISLRRAAKMVGMSYQTVLNAERGNTSFESTLRVAKGLGVVERTLLRAARADAAELAATI